MSDFVLSIIGAVLLILLVALWFAVRNLIGSIRKDLNPLPHTVEDQKE